MTYTNIRFLKDMWLFLDGRRFSFLCFTVLRFISSAAVYVELWILGLIVTFLSTYQRGDSLSTFYFLVAIVFFVFASRISLRFFSKYFLQKIGAYLRKDLRMKAMKQLLLLDLSWHENQDTGAKIQKITDGGDKIVHILFRFSNEWLEIISSITVGLILFTIINPIYAIYSVLFIISYSIIYSFFYQKVILLKRKEAKMREFVSGKIHESASNIHSVKSLGLDESVLKSTSDVEQKYFDVWLENKRFSVIRSTILLVFMAVIWTGFLLLLGTDYLAGLFTIGLFVTYSGYFNNIRDALHKSIWEVIEFTSARVATERFMTILGADQFREQEFGKKNISKNWSSISFNHVGFSYKSKKVLDDISFKIKKGEKVALVGKSGSGKSTITKLFLDLYEPNSGSIMIDNTILQSYKKSKRNDFFSTVLQDSEVFNISLEDNIRFHRKESKKGMLDTCLKVSQLTELVQKLPEGLKTQIGEKGYKLSGGERQRLGIARALYSEFDLLILDEATSSLDSKTEQKIVTSIQKEFKDKTQIIVAHRLSTIRHVDTIYFLERGKIVEFGSHADLLRKKGKYYELWRLQNDK